MSAAYWPPYWPALCLLGLWNIATLALMAVDKRRAHMQKRRIRERTLWLCAALLGSVGILAGMWAFRHKTRHMAFVIGMPLLLAAQVALAALLLR